MAGRPHQKRPRSVVVWITDYRGTRHRYIRTVDGQLVSLGQYLNGILEHEEECERVRRERHDQATLERWAAMWRATKGNNNGSPHNGQG